MIELADIPNVKEYLCNHSDGYKQDKYGDRIMEIINDARYYLVDKTLFVKQVACELNDERVLREMFDEYIDNFILNYADGENMEMYIVMTDKSRTYTEPISFWDIWRKDLFDYMVKTYKFGDLAF